MKMKNLAIILVLAIVAFTFDACKKDDKKDYNTLKINDGEFSGYSYTFSPTAGFWSPANETTRSVQIVLGSNDVFADPGENVMVLYFYYNGNSQVSFPSAEGQWIEFGLNIDGTVYMFKENSAVLVIYQMDDYNFEGTLSGEFVDLSNSLRTITFTMDISVALQQI
jgi:hypothetical protein